MASFSPSVKAKSIHQEPDHLVVILTEAIKNEGGDPFKIPHLFQVRLAFKALEVGPNSPLCLSAQDDVIVGGH